jgi:hypothetical protein
MTTRFATISRLGLASALCLPTFSFADTVTTSTVYDTINRLPAYNIDTNCVLANPAPGSVQASNKWTPVCNHTATYEFPTVVGLDNGTALIFSGYDAYGRDVFARVDLYNDALQSFAPTALAPTVLMHFECGSPTAVRLANGKVLVICGESGTAEVYDPQLEQFSTVGKLVVDHFVPTATLLKNGRVLIAGGMNNGIAEIFNPATGKFSRTGDMTIARFAHAATLLPNGKVLITGGSHYYGPPDYAGTAVNLAEIYDPATGTFSATGTMAHARASHSATLLRSGKVAITGGDFLTYNPYEQSNPVLQTEIYDPAAGTFIVAASSAHPHGRGAALLGSGKVLLPGDSVVVQSNYPPELYDPAANSFSPAGGLPLSFPEAGALLDNGRYLNVGHGDGAVYQP